MDVQEEAVKSKKRSNGITLYDEIKSKRVIESKSRANMGDKTLKCVELAHVQRERQILKLN